MFLSPEHPSAFTSVDYDSIREMGAEDTLWQNLAVFQEIENVLEDYPEHPYQAAFSIAELRQKLVAHVLKHLPHRDVVMGNAQKPTVDTKPPYRLKQERLRLEALIRGSILHLLRENADWVSRRLQSFDSSGNNSLKTLR